MVGRRTGGLDNKHILTADVLFDLGERLAVREGCNGEFSWLDANVTADGFGKREIRTTGEYFHVSCRSGWVFRFSLQISPARGEKGNNWQTPIKRIRTTTNNLSGATVDTLGQVLGQATSGGGRRNLSIAPSRSR